MPSIKNQMSGIREGRVNENPPHPAEPVPGPSHAVHPILPPEDNYVDIEIIGEGDELTERVQAMVNVVLAGTVRLSLQAAAPGGITNPPPCASQPRPCVTGPPPCVSEPPPPGNGENGEDEEQVGQEVDNESEGQSATDAEGRREDEVEGEGENESEQEGGNEVEQHVPLQPASQEEAEVIVPDEMPTPPPPVPEPPAPLEVLELPVPLEEPNPPALLEAQMNTLLASRRAVEDHIQFVDFANHVRVGAGGAYRCLFTGHGCLRSFQTRVAMLGHLVNCRFGTLLFCKASECNSRDGRMMASWNAFVQHAATNHNLTVLEDSSMENLLVALDREFCNPIENGYTLRVLQRMHFSRNDHVFEVVLVGLVEELGLLDRRLLIVPVLCSGDSENHDVVEVSCTLKQESGATIQPLTHPGFDINNLARTATLYALRNPAELLDARSFLDGVLSYSLADLTADGNHQVYLDLRMNGTQCRVKRDNLVMVPPQPIALSWQDLDVHDDVRAAMTDGNLPSPNPETRIIIPQMRGQSDFIIEAVNTTKSVNAVMAGMTDYVLHLGPANINQRRPVQAVVVYPTVSLMHKYKNEWIRRTEGLDVDVYIFDANLPCLFNQLRTHGTDILLITPTLWVELLETARPAFLEILTRQVKFIFLHHLHKMCFTEILANVESAISKIPIDAIGTIRIGYLELMSDFISTTCRPAEQRLGIFNQGWYQFHIGKNPEQCIQEMGIETLPFSATNAKITEVLRLIQEYRDMKWLVIAMKGRDTTTDDIDKLYEDVKAALQPRRLTLVKKETEIFGNKNFWNPFLQRSDAVLIGPWFLLDSAQMRNCDGVIVFSQPYHRADWVRIGKITWIRNNDFKPCYRFLLP